MTKKPDSARTATAYLVLERDGRVTIEVPDAAFEPLLVGPKLSFEIDETIKAVVTKADGAVE